MNSVIRKVKPHDKAIICYIKEIEIDLNLSNREQFGIRGGQRFTTPRSAWAGIVDELWTKEW